MPKLIEVLLARQYLMLILIALLLLGGGINTYSLRGSTEPREAGIAAEMLQDSQYLVPRLNGRDFLEKPPLSYWLQAAALHTLGYQPLAVRLPSIAASIACVCLVFFSLKKICANAELAWLGALSLLTMASFWMNARTAGQDALLTFGVALALFSFNFAHATPSRWLPWLAYALGLCIATLTKGVVGLAVPGIIILSYLLIEIFAIERKFVWGHWWRPALFAVIGLLPLLLWLFSLYQRQGAAAVQQILWSNSIDRFAGDYQFGAHSEPFYYYLKKLPETFAPWNLLLFFALWQLRHEMKRDKNTLFFICWLVAPYLLLSLSAGKRPPYLLMIYPTAATLIALFVRNAAASLAQKTQPTAIYRLALLQTLMLSGISGFIVWHAWKLHLHGAAIVLAIFLIAALATAWRNLLAREWRQLSSYSLLVMLIVYTGYGAAMLQHEKRQDSSDAIFAQMRALEHEGHTLVLFGPIERVAGAANFYLQHSIPALDDAAQLQVLLERDRTVAALVAESDLAQLHDYRVLANFLDQKRKYSIVAGAAATP
ncbi:MAG TPA: glycosyltransferase family 39 protein [Spongiibacteraceae bacterium]